MGCCGSNDAASSVSEEKMQQESQAGKSETKTKKPATSEPEEAGAESVKGDVMKKYKFTRTLGKGASCRVVEAVAKDGTSHERLAIKIMSKERSALANMYRAEVDVLTKLSNGGKTKHRNVIQFWGAEEDETNYFILTKLCHGGELFDRIVSKEDKYKMTEKSAAGMVRAMLEAVKFCHDQGVAHRDLKPENFVFENEEVEANLVLIDFGCATMLEDEKDKTYENLVGTAYYLAPEMAYVALSRSSKDDISSKYSPMVKPRTADILKASDVWSIGVIAYVMLTGRAPFRGRTNELIFRSIVESPVQYPLKDVRYKTPLQLSSAFRDFVDKVLVKDPGSRPSVEDCLRHPWVQGVEGGEWELNQDVIRFLRQFNYQSKLKKAITAALASNMTEDSEQQVKRHFVRLDADRDGFLDADELVFLLTDMGYAATEAKKEAIEMIKQADQNQDGVIDFEEFKAIWYRKVLTTNDQYIHRVFNVFDKNGDGQIELTELQEGLSDNFIHSEEDDEEDFEQLRSLQSMITEVDQNGDNMISFQEFKDAMKEDIENGKFSADSYQVGGKLSPDIEYAS